MLKLTTGDLWDEAAGKAVDNGCYLTLNQMIIAARSPTSRRFRERISRGRAIRLKCGACMGGEVDQMPRGEVARAVDECGSCMCPL